VGLVSALHEEPLWNSSDGPKKARHAITTPLFLAFDPPSAIGLFLISDGVSISEYGTGDMASACVRAETTEFWRRLCTPAASGDDDAPLPSAPTQPGAGPNAPGPTLPAGLEARERILTEVLDAANHRIAELIHDELPRFPGPPEGIMAATAVGVVPMFCPITSAAACSSPGSRVPSRRDRRRG
jgi:hypothetical protein